MIKKWKTANKWSIYALRDPETGQIRYVGCTALPLQTRLKAHLAEAQPYAYYISRKDYWLITLKVKRLKPLVELLEVVETDPLLAERAWITKLRAQGVDLTNDAGPILLSKLARNDPARNRNPVPKPASAIISSVLTVKQAAAILEVHPSRVRKLCDLGLLRAARFGRAWVITPEDLARYAAQPRRGSSRRPSSPDLPIKAASVTRRKYARNT